MLRKKVFMVIWVLMILWTSTVNAATINWNKDSGNWFTTSNWDLNRLPTNMDNTYITNGGIASVTTNVGSCSTLYLGGAGGGTIQLSGGSLVEYRACVGYNGIGTFIQSGGNSSPSGYLYLGYNSGDTGNYTLSGSGILSSTYQYIGYSGNGNFSQTDAKNSPQMLYIGYNSEASGTYTMSGNAQLTSNEQYIAYHGFAGPSSNATGLLQQNGGVNTTSSLFIGKTGTYRLSGGTLQLSSDLLCLGTIDGDNGNGVMKLSSNSIIDFSQGSIINANFMSISIGTNSLVLVPPGFDVNASFGSYISQGLTHMVGAPLVIQAGQGFSGRGTITDLLDCKGTVSSYYQNDYINLNGGLKLYDKSWVTLGSGKITTNDTISVMSGGNLVTAAHYIGKSGNGSFTQTGGNYTLNDDGYIDLGFNAGDSGNYNMESGSLRILDRTYTNIGFNGTGCFNQSGGTVSINQSARSLTIASNSKSCGSYLLSNGELTCLGLEIVGRQGVGTFTQTGGIHTNRSWLCLGQMAGGEGTYTLSDSGQLFTQTTCIGDGGTGTFTQAGGINSISSKLYLGYQAGSQGTYNLNGGALILKSISTVSGTPTFNFGGGTLQASGSFTTAIPMTLTGNNGNANVDTASYAVNLSGALIGIGGLNKNGKGTLTLSAINSYTGPTTITTGTLALGTTGTLASGIIDVSNGAAFDVSEINGGFYLGSNQTLKGSGKIIGNITIIGMHAPGDLLGIETVQGNYDMMGQLQIELAGPKMGIDYDQVLLSGSVDYNAVLSGTLSLDWADMNGSTDSTQLWILKNDTAGTLSGVFSNYANGASLGNYDGHDWKIWYGADAATGNFTGGNDVLITAVPEPGVFILLMTAILGIGVVSFRRKRHQLNVITTHPQ